MGHFCYLWIVMEMVLIGVYNGDFACILSNNGVTFLS